MAKPISAATKMATCWLADWNELTNPFSRRRDFGEIDRNAAELDAGRKSLQQPAGDDDDRRREADRRVARRQGDDDGADRHDRQRDDQPLAAADAVDIGAEIDRAERAHQRADPEHDEGDERVEMNSLPVGKNALPIGWA